MNVNIVLAGVGGQGVLSLAVLIAQAALNDGLEVRQSEVHGMAQRGGAVSAHLRISDRPIASDLIPSGTADLILSMEPLESLRYLSFLKPDGLIITAQETVNNIAVYPEIEKVFQAVNKQKGSLILEIQSLAKACGSAKAGNMVLIGAASLHLPLKRESLEKAVGQIFSSKDQSVRDINQKAFEVGRSQAESRRNA